MVNSVGLFREKLVRIGRMSLPVFCYKEDGSLHTGCCGEFGTENAEPVAADLGTSKLGRSHLGFLAGGEASSHGPCDGRSVHWQNSCTNTVVTRGRGTLFIALGGFGVGAYGGRNFGPENFQYFAFLNRRKLGFFWPRISGYILVTAPGGTPRFIAENLPALSVWAGVFWLAVSRTMPKAPSMFWRIRSLWSGISERPHGGGQPSGQGGLVRCWSPNGLFIFTGVDFGGYTPCHPNFAITVYSSLHYNGLILVGRGIGDENYGLRF